MKLMYIVTVPLLLCSLIILSTAVSMSAAVPCLRCTTPAVSQRAWVFVPLISNSRLTDLLRRICPGDGRVVQNHLVHGYAWRRQRLHHPMQGDYLSGKPGNVREFDSCQWNVRDFTKSQGSVGENILSGKSCLQLFVESCIFVSILNFDELVHFILV